MDFTHFDSDKNAIMVDVGHKESTMRQAKACGIIYMSKECFTMVKEGNAKKGNVLAVAQTAGIMGAKRTWELIPLCHIINLTKLSVEFQYVEDENAIKAICTAAAYGPTGVEMEALTGVNVTLLTIYDMCKAVDKHMEIGNIYLMEKTGGKSGHFINGNHKEEET